MHHVIIGAGPAGVIAAETLRGLDAESRITLISGEDEPPYSRMAIPYYLIGNIDEEGTYLRHAEGHYEDLKIDVVHQQVTAVDPTGHSVTLGEGNTLAYDRLLIATGARPIRPPIDGLDLPRVQTCWTLEDARKIAEMADAGSHVVLLGAGFIGSIVLEALAERHVDLTVVEMGDRMVPRMMDETAGGMLKSWCETKGVRVLTSTRITKLEPAPAGAPAGDTIAVDLDNGEQVAAHLVVISAGVTPNVEFLDGSGIEVDRGIVVDDRMRASVPDVYAAGDVARGRDISTGGFDIHAIQPTAAEHGRTAALNMAGQDVAYPGSLQMNVLDTLGLISCSFGAWQGVDGGQSARILDKPGHRYLRLEFDGDHLVGAQAVGLTEHLGMARGLIQSRTSLGNWKDVLLANPQRLSEAYVACLYP